MMCPAEAEDGRVTMGELDAAGLSWTSWDMIEYLRRADQAHSGATFTSTGVVYGVADPAVTVASDARRVGVT